MNTKLRRSVVAVATALACLTMMAPPAGATVVTFRAHFDSGTGIGGALVYVNGTNTMNVPFGGLAGGTGCGGHIDLSMDIDSTGSTGTAVQVLGIQKTFRFYSLSSSFVFVITYISTPASGTISGSSTTGATIAGLGLRFKIEVYTAMNTSATATDCARSTTLVCRFNNVTPTFSGTWNNNIHNIQASDGGTLNSNAAPLFGLPCSPPFSYYTGGFLTISGLPIHACAVPIPTTTTSCP